MGLGNEISQNSKIDQQEEVSLTKGLYAVFDIKTEGLSKFCHHIINITAEVLALDRTRINNSKFHSLVRTPVNIPPIITELTGILNGDVADCQQILVVGKELLMFLKKLPISYLWPTMGKSLTFFFMTALSKNVTEAFSGNTYMLQKYFQ